MRAEVTSWGNDEGWADFPNNTGGRPLRVRPRLSCFLFPPSGRSRRLKNTICFLLESSGPFHPSSPPLAFLTLSDFLPQPPTSDSQGYRKEPLMSSLVHPQPAPPPFLSACPRGPVALMILLEHFINSELSNSYKHSTGAEDSPKTCSTLTHPG